MPMDYSAARRRMIDCQLLPNRVNSDAVIEAFDAAPRELFLPEDKRPLAYSDEAVEAAPGRYLMEPMILARLIEESAPRPNDVALVAGGATGYAAAVLARLVSTVIMVEPSEALANQASETLAALGFDTVAVTAGPCAGGAPKHAPFDLILVDGALADIPETLTAQLAEGGRLAAVVESGGAGGLGRGVIVSRHAGVFSTRAFADLGTPCLPGLEKAPAAFVF
ncbi:MAG: protein-L-isoaspartate O-methyltransferase family protein [Rhodospirillales bacterium]